MRVVFLRLYLTFSINLYVYYIDRNFVVQISTTFFIRYFARSEMMKRQSYRDIYLAQFSEINRKVIKERSIDHLLGNVNFFCKQDKTRVATQSILVVVFRLLVEESVCVRGCRRDEGDPASNKTNLRNPCPRKPYLVALGAC